MFGTVSRLVFAKTKFYENKTSLEINYTIYDNKSLRKWIVGEHYLCTKVVRQIKKEMFSY